MKVIKLDDLKNGDFVAGMYLGGIDGFVKVESIEGEHVVCKQMINIGIVNGKQKWIPANNIILKNQSNFLVLTDEELSNIST